MTGSPESADDCEDATAQGKGEQHYGRPVQAAHGRGFFEAVAKFFDLRPRLAFAKASTGHGEAYRGDKPVVVWGACDQCPDQHGKAPGTQCGVPSSACDCRHIAEQFANERFQGLGPFVLRRQDSATKAGRITHEDVVVIFPAGCTVTPIPSVYDDPQSLTPGAAAVNAIPPPEHRADNPNPAR